MKKQLLTIAVLSSLLFAACGENNKKTENNAQTTEEAGKSGSASDKGESEQGGNFLTNRDALKKAEAELKDMPKFKGKDVKVFQNIHFYEDGRVQLALQDPDKPENIDDYLFQGGKWQEPQAVQISGDGDMSANVFSLSTLKFETVADIYKQVEEQSKEVEGAKIDGHIYYNLNVMHQSGQWITGVQGSRGQYSGYFNADGSLKEFKKN
ncbi:hypothetical protein [Sphingobacterium paucimobilis]|uniref:Beta-lactamase-inhibitor-like PepSY-like domain-containing protein n=1 Tax=Sphingobacterium paucimobilis HER1398 TaxID=1346330 RepID=U2J6A7_9SPHI|nr:hypothetical protein [Sphingobacterium paucimobilis]ERJ60459.1 hypothetical protein M472_17035 [Sphingobacterium paucimobilis HER1398]